MKLERRLSSRNSWLCAEPLAIKKGAFTTVGCVLVSILVLELGTFNLWNFRALNRQAMIQSYIYGFIQENLNGRGVEKAVILAEYFTLQVVR